MNKKAKKPAAPGLPGLIFALVLLFALPSNKLRLVWRMLGRGSSGLRMLMRDPQSLLIALAFAVLALIALVSFIRLITGGAPKKAVSSAGKAVKVRPVSFADARDLCDMLLSGRAVVINMEGVQVELAQRIIDFASGACYAIDGNLQKISSYIFIVTPANIELSGDFQSMISSVTNNNLRLDD